MPRLLLSILRWTPPLTVSVMAALFLAVTVAAFQDPVFPCLPPYPSESKERTSMDPPPQTLPYQNSSEDLSPQPKSATMVANGGARQTKLLARLQILKVRSSAFPSDHRPARGHPSGCPPDSLPARGHPSGCCPDRLPARGHLSGRPSDCLPVRGHPPGRPPDLQGRPLEIQDPLSFRQPKTKT